VVPNGRIRATKRSFTALTAEAYAALTAHDQEDMIRLLARKSGICAPNLSEVRLGFETMCGIVGYVGARPALKIVVDGLRRLEYRGYDSAGVAVVHDGALVACKRAGKLANLEKALLEAPDGDRIAAGVTGIGHTRWATHGGPTDRNAHPHRSHRGKIAVIHNGIIENFAPLRAELESCGVEFASETDTESAAHLLERTLEAVRAEGRFNGDPGRQLAEAMRRVCRLLEGAFTLLAIDADTPDAVVGARRNSPLVVGRGADGENFLASDVSAFIEHTREAVELGQDQVVLITPDLIEVTDFDGELTVGKDFHIDWDASAAQKGGYDYFMLKEIAEQPRAVADTLRGRLADTGEIQLDEVRLTNEDIRLIDKIFIVACGTAYHAGMVAKYAIEHWTRIPCEVELASEFRYRDPVLDRSTLVVAISQSGETMDTLMALRHARDQKARVLAICNTNGSTIPRESDAVLYTHAGPEIAVASTKAFLTQLVACYLVGLHLAQVRGNKYVDEVSVILSQLQEMPYAVEQVLETIEPVRDLARDLASSRSVLFIGRHVGYPVALEGALKLKELAYMHAEGFAAGELKHGPIALVDDGTPVVCIVPSPRGRSVLHEKVISNIQEVRARGARTIVIAERGDEAVRAFADHLIEVPPAPTLFAPLVTTVPLQVLACEIATARGHDVDQPRNLAKSVTVE
jgi:glucosamine--fructose-6-phosphate aminotransferase (isomerizing)